MLEIRVGWLFGLHENDAGKPLAGGGWLPDSPETRRELSIIVEAGREVCGAGTHWLEVRRAAPFRFRPQAPGARRYRICT